jgi:hypothetical protein
MLSERMQELMLRLAGLLNQAGEYMFNCPVL